jgi:hypothetical protein
MSNEDFAQELARRLNGLIDGDPAVADALRRIMNVVVRVGPPHGRALLDHPTIQVGSPDGGKNHAEVSFLGFLNGACGGPIVGAYFDDDTSELEHFAVLDKEQ